MKKREQKSSKDQSSGQRCRHSPPDAHDAAFHHLLISSPPSDHPRLSQPASPSDIRDRPRRINIVNTSEPSISPCSSSTIRQDRPSSADPILLCIPWLCPPSPRFRVSIFFPCLPLSLAFLARRVLPTTTRNFAWDHPCHAQDVPRYGLAHLVQTRAIMYSSTLHVLDQPSACIAESWLTQTGSLISIPFPTFPSPICLIIHTLVLNPPRLHLVLPVFHCSTFLYHSQPLVQ